MLIQIHNQISYYFGCHIIQTKSSILISIWMITINIAMSYYPRTPIRRYRGASYSLKQYYLLYFRSGGDWACSNREDGLIMNVTSQNRIYYYSEELRGLIHKQVCLLRDLSRLQIISQIERYASPIE